METIRCYVPTSILKYVISDLESSGHQIRAINTAEQTHAPFYTLVDVTNNEFNIRRLVAKSVQTHQMLNFQEKTKHWECGVFIPVPTQLSSLTHIKMFLGKQHSNKQRLEKLYHVCIYICSLLDNHARVYVASDLRGPRSTSQSIHDIIQNIDEFIGNIKESPTHQ